MKKILILILTILPCGYAFSQIGINTDNPQGIFNVHPQTGTDIIVTEEGNLGIGLLNPTNKLEVQGTSILRNKVTVNNGTQGNLKAFISDENGTGSWSFLQTLKKVYINYNLNSGATNLHSGSEELYLMDDNTTTSLSGDIADLNFELKSFSTDQGAVTKGFTLKEGQYLFMLSSNIASTVRGEQSAEYGILRIKSNNTTGTNELFKTYYMLSTNGRYAHAEVNKGDQIYLTFEAVDPQVKDNNGNSFFLAPPYSTQNDKASLLVIYLKPNEN